MSTFTAMMAHSLDINLEKNTEQMEKLVGWFYSRKLNGHRTLWNGYQLETLGRYSGPKPVNAPDWWLKNLPQGIPLDGELWHETDDTGIVKSICGQGKEKSLNDSRWNEIQYKVFGYKPFSCDTISSPELLSSPFFNNENWNKRQIKLFHLFITNLQNNPVVKYVTQSPVNSIEDIQNAVKLSKSQRWEGLMFANPLSKYECKRVRNLLKWKTQYTHEGFVVGEYPGEGKHEGRMGGLIVELTWDDTIKSVKGGTPDMIGKQVKFNVGGGFLDTERDNSKTLFPINTQISFSFLGVSPYGVPISPNAIRE